MSHSYDEERRIVEAQIERCIGGLMKTVNAVVLANALLHVSLRLVARRFPTKLSTVDRNQIRENCKTTDALISERAMDQHGVATTVAQAAVMACIAVDYSPLSNVKTSIDADDVLPNDVREEISDSICEVFEAAEDLGMSPYGSACSLICHAVSLSLDRGVPKFALAQVLASELHRSVMENESDPPDDENTVESLRSSWGLSTAEVRRQLEHLTSVASTKKPS